MPDEQWLQDLLAYLRFDCDGLVRGEAKARRDKFRYQVQLDIASGAQRAGFQAIRAPDNPPFTEVPCVVSVPIHCTSPTADGAAWFTLARATCLRVPGLAHVSGMECTLMEQEGKAVRISAPDLPEHGELRQCFVACTPEELQAAFRDFWGPLWQRDAGTASSSLEQWPEFEDCLAASGPPLPPLSVRSFAPDLWADAIRRMGKKKATGACGWAPSDLKLLSPAAIRVLNMTFHQAITIGLPDHLMRAKVGVLAKSPDPTSIRESRPITVLATVYRVWSSVFTRQVLHQWRPAFPSTIAGSMPGRACRDLSYLQQHQLELSILSSTPRLGMSLDIVKAFMGWPPLFCMLQRAGVPRAELEFWFRCLRDLQRFPVLLGQMGEGIGCDNGAPEGDPFSVAAMACTCFWVHRYGLTRGALFESYVDNWAWSSASRSALRAALPKGLRFLRALQLPVDWKKSYVWATKRPDRKWWLQIFPKDSGLRLVTETRELGVAFKYDGRGHAVLRRHRLEEGFRRLERLRNQPRSVLEGRTGPEGNLAGMPLWC